MPRSRSRSPKKGNCYDLSYLFIYFLLSKHFSFDVCQAFEHRFDELLVPLYFTLDRRGGRSRSRSKERERRRDKGEIYSKIH